MPTTRGLVCVAAGLGCIFLGWLFGLIEMYVLGATLLALAVIAIGVAFLRPIKLGVARTVTPSRLHVGSTGRVELAVRNGPTKTPVLRMSDHVEGTAGARLFLSPLKADEVARAAYKLPTERRGIVSVGPVDFEATDPFGLAIRRFTAVCTGQLVVYPEVIPLPPAPPSPATERRSTSDRPEFLGGRSEEFHALRPYVPGDDMRRVNWAATARHDELTVREDEAPTQNHLTVLLDNASLESGPALDKGATVAASLVTSMRDRSDPFRLITVDGQDTAYVLGTAGLDHALGILATVDHTPRPEVKFHVDTPKAQAQGALVVVAGPQGSVRARDLGAYGRIMTVTLAPSVWDDSVSPPISTAEAVGRDIELTLGHITDLRSMWARAITTLMSTGGVQ